MPTRARNWLSLKQSGRAAPATPGSARDLIDSAKFIWHQRFELAPGVYTPGVSDVEMMWHMGRLPEDLTGKTVLDIGTTNGGTAFAAERRGAARVVAVDILEPSWFGFDVLRAHLGSNVEFMQASVYDLPFRLAHERFDIVVFWGVLYHLRHPLLALDNVRALSRGATWVESAVCDGEIPEAADLAVARFYRRDELNGDGSNWFAPTSRLLLDWCCSCGLEAELVWHTPDRAMARCVPIEPEWPQISYEHPLDVNVSLG